MVKRIAFLINPIAGSGLALNLKDSDSISELPGNSHSVKEGEKFLQSIVGSDAAFLVPSGIMGEDSLAKYGFSFEIITRPGKMTTGLDTIEFARIACSRGCDLLVFVGGDGTARDIFSAIGERIPVLGIPAGIKGNDGETEKDGVYGLFPVFITPSSYTAMVPVPSRSMAECVMGEDSLAKYGFSFEIITSPGKMTTGLDTIEFARAVQSKGCDLLVFVGGDGTARDIFSAIGERIPVLGIPAGIKMYSSVYALNFNHAADLFKKFIQGEGYEIYRGEVADLDAGYFKGQGFHINYFGDLRVIGDSSSPKFSKSEVQADDISGIVDFVIENMRKDAYYFLGPGSTCKAITRNFGGNPDLLGIDVIRNGIIVKLDASENDLIKFSSEQSFIVVSPLGDQGFLLGRGNRQITGRVMERVGFENLIVIASRLKMDRINSLYVDIDFPVDCIPKYLRVIIGYGETRIVKTVFR